MYKAKSFAKLSTVQLFRRWHATAGGNRRGGPGERDLELCLEEIDCRYLAVTRPILALLTAARPDRKEWIDGEFVHAFYSGLHGASREERDVRYYPVVVWSRLEIEFGRIERTLELRPQGDFRDLKPKFMARMFIDELPEPERQLLVLASYSPLSGDEAGLRLKIDSSHLARRLASSIDSLHGMFRRCRDLDDVTDRSIPRVLVHRLDRVAAGERVRAYFELLQLAARG